MLHRLWLLLLVAVFCAVAAFFYTKSTVVPMYQSSALFYVNNSVFGQSVSISYADLTASKGLVGSYIVILKSRPTLEEIADYADSPRSSAELRGMLSASSVDDTEIFRVTVTSQDPQEAADLANAAAVILPKRISSVIDGTSAKVIETAVPAGSPSNNDSYTTNVLLAFMLGFVFVAAIIAIREIFDTTIRTAEDIKQVCDLPILSEVPDIGSSGKENRYYYDRAYAPQKQQEKPHGAEKGKIVHGVIGDDTPFVVSEAYKLLRTKVEFSFADGKNSHVIGVSSALSGEGKSVSSINLAYALAQMDKRVLLVECDLRRPSISMKLGLNRIPGLTNLLSQKITAKEIVQVCEQKNGNPIHVVTAGRIPPNPIELLGSAKMSEILDSFKESYDYIILDLPPVLEVSDALVTAKFVDGMLLVVRENYCDRTGLSATIRQFQFVGAHLLGVLVNCTIDDLRRYPKSYDGHYGRHKYAGAYASRSRAYRRSYRKYSQPQEVEMAEAEAEKEQGKK
ncbi:MAG: polysaccharide biosynthesis tyrosine autokinase [Oscillospiraceae bacterium]|nr:polysaccharide biosynthesis tyrosine autokinase [Oscillospiraceae bacterium]